MVITYIACNLRAKYLWYQYLNVIVPIYFHVCTRAIGNLTLKRIWVHFIEAKVVYLDSEREKEAVLLEEMHGNQELMVFYDLVNSLIQSFSKEYSNVVQTSASKTI